ncbi:SCO family protein [Undibacterium umbellatum]|uniref:SCO family protein n=1 Tax=Undibacterium umbellatum TaxID=2762300 RepID=A0ABR6ZDT2_9BURK|nr:SCO family protein [Undibacterium umbellatum]MBC3909789.1 SCO family protein [Undibacterium umbellatum]
MKRRSVLTLLGSMSLLACSRTPVAFNGIDITGAAYAKDFLMRGHDGKDYSLASFKGKCLLIFFGFTQCPDVCPTALSRAVHIRKLLADKAEQLQVVFITIDPERDTPELLAQYMKAFDPGFLALYGDLKQTQDIAADFKVFYQKVPSGSSYTMDHTSISYVFDAQGKIRLALKHEQTAEQCAADLRALMAA